ncbi:helix-turn-helix domain-containing protein [Mycolicibacterium rhodesiae]|uniref:helix-turn-helix domain-containing protein n=1 Tax=Mycolicibacterium rhodesiae TaxID=36814 RepID=UPI0009F3FA8B|nr:helix-turn-helix domain-containing protein [Mycolicibacterium rhodesiae]MCV7348279.1 helix-turn-helix domain-containing protein [Mycolicibacterium rhodesiae]
MLYEKPENLPRLVTFVRCATELSCSTRTVERYVRQGRLKAVRIGPKMLRVERESLLAMIGGA